MKEVTEQGAFLQLAQLCARSEHCQHDMLEKMRRWEMSEEAQARVMARLVSERYVDDERYAHAFVRDKYRFSQWGTTEIRHALRLKNIPSECYADAIEEIDSEEYLSALTDLLRRKLRSVKAANDYERNGKLIRFAASHGYGMDDILRCLKQIGCDEVDMD